jgi:toxin ParE1/3/4
MSYVVEITDQARKDLRGIYEYIAFTLQSRINADRQLGRIEREILSLAEMPERYEALNLDFEAAKTVRLVTVDRYCVIYCVAKERGAVQILRILYGGRDIPAELEKDMQ